jgi:cytochrome P450
MADGNLGVATIDGLDDSFDHIIRGLPQGFVRSGLDLLRPQDDAPDRVAQLFDPFTVLGRLRDQGHPVILRDADGKYAGLDIRNVCCHDLSEPHAVVLSYAAASAIGSDRTRFLNDGAYGASAKASGRTINTYDGSDHRSLRRLFDTAIFGRAKMDEWTSAISLPTIEYLVQRVKRMIANGETPDAARDLALPAAYKSISTIIGIPQEAFGNFLARVKVMKGFDNIETTSAGFCEFENYFRDRLVERRADPKPDMITIMANTEVGGRKLTDDEIVKHCAFLLPGGIDTTWLQTTNLILCALMFPAQYRAVVEDPSLVDSFVEEAIRWAPSAFAAPRFCAQDTVVAGVEISAGTSICSITGVANRDPRMFDHPNVFDARRDPNPHLTFHIGVHYCMGQNLARFTLRTMLATLAREVPTLDFAGDRRELRAEAYGGRYAKPLLLTA